MPLIRPASQTAGPPERREAAVAGPPEHIRLTRAAPGCRGFDVTPDPVVAGRAQVADLVECKQAVESHKARSDARARATARAAGHPSVRIEEVVG